MNNPDNANGKREEKCDCDLDNEYICKKCWEEHNPPKNDSRREGFMTKEEMKDAHEIANWTGNASLTINQLIIRVDTLQSQVTTLQAKNAELVSKVKVAEGAIKRVSTELQKPNIGIKDTIWCSDGDITVVEVLERALSFIRSSPSSI